MYNFNMLKKNLKFKYRRKHHFGPSPYILGLQLIWSLHFGSNQFGPCYIHLAINLVVTVKSLRENAYVANGMLCWHT